MTNCLEGYLTSKCKDCEFWKNTNEEIGCACPFPISHCEAFSQEEGEDKNEVNRCR